MTNIIENLKHKGSFYRFNGIISCVQSKKITEEVIEQLKILKTDYSRIAGHTISDFSIAALDILGVEKYEGNDPSVKELIKSKFNF